MIFEFFGLMVLTLITYYSGGMFHSYAGFLRTEQWRYKVNPAVPEMIEKLESDSYKSQIRENKILRRKSRKPKTLEQLEFDFNF